LRWGLLLVICSWCGFFTPAAGAETRAGVGLQVVPVATGDLVVLQVVPYSPAAVSGLAPGDLLIRVGERVLAGSNFEEVSREELWGGVGTEVTLVYLRPGVAGSRSVSLKRAPLKALPSGPPGVDMLVPGPLKKAPGQ
jgi:C-terminal processing protease CtpA/Prc